MRIKIRQRQCFYFYFQISLRKRNQLRIVACADRYAFFFFLISFFFSSYSTQKRRIISQIIIRQKFSSGTVREQVRLKNVFILYSRSNQKEQRPPGHFELRYSSLSTSARHSKRDVFFFFLLFLFFFPFFWCNRYRTVGRRNGRHRRSRLDFRRHGEKMYRAGERRARLARK